MLGEFAGREGQLVSGVIQQSADPKNVHVQLGDVEAFLPAHEQVPTETYTHGERIRGYVLDVGRGMKGPSITLSRTHPGLVRRLFELEVPEIADGTVEIMALAREAGHRSKVAVRATVPGVNAKGACIGPMGARVRAVMAELRDEKIDIVDWDDDPATFVGHALSPARVVSVTVVDPVAQGGACGRARLPPVARDRQGGPERAARRPADGVAHRHQVRRGPRGPRSAGRAAVGARPRARNGYTDDAEKPVSYCRRRLPWTLGPRAGHASDAGNGRLGRTL